MPELPEVETVCRGLRPVMVGSTITNVRLNRANLRYPFPKDFAKKLQGQQIVDITRRAKYIKIHLGSGEELIIHLGMSGRMIIETTSRPDAKHEHVIFELSNGYNVRYMDPRRFGLMDISNEKYFAKLGPEPFSSEFNPAYLLGKLKASPIKAALLDQTIVAGLGNIYVCEALFRSRINPTRPGANIALNEAADIVKHSIEILNEAIISGGSTLRDHAQPNGESGYFQHNFAVYGRENKPCITCAQPISRITQSGRSTFYCPACQPK